MSRGATRRALLLGCGAATFMAAGCATAAPLPFQPVRRRTPDVTLTSHRREQLRWLGDIVQGPRAGLIGLTFLGCVSQCPPSDVLFQQLDAQAPADIDLYTLTIDPLADDWRRLRRKAEEMGSSPRWRWLTGEAREVFALLDALDVAYGNLDWHGQVILRAGAGRLARLDTLPDNAAQLLAGL